MRYARYGLVAVLVASLIFAVPQVSHAQGKTLTVKVDKDSYATGDSIHVTGTVPAVLEGQPVALQVFNPRNTMYTIAQPTVNADGTFSYDFKIGGKLGIDGVYTVKATYSGQSVQATFQFTSGAPLGGPAAGTIKVQFEDHTWNVPASLSNGQIQKITVDKDFTSVVLTVSTTDKDGTLTITLPRDMIDAKTSNGKDDKFTVLVDGDETQATETGTTATDRTLSIPVKAGAAEVEIIGTIVVPEFGILAALVLATAVGTIIIVSRKNQILQVLTQH